MIWKMAERFSGFACRVFAPLVEKKAKKTCSITVGICSFVIPIIVSLIISNGGIGAWFLVLLFTIVGLVINLSMECVISAIDTNDEKERQNEKTLAFTELKNVYVSKLSEAARTQPLHQVYNCLAAAVYKATEAYLLKAQSINVYIYVYDIKTQLHKRVGKYVGYDGLQSGDLHSQWKTNHKAEYLYEYVLNQNMVAYAAEDSDKICQKMHLTGEGVQELYKNKLSQYAGMVFTYCDAVKLYVEVISFKKTKLGKDIISIDEYISNVIAPFADTLCSIDWIKERMICDGADAKEK